MINQSPAELLKTYEFKKNVLPISHKTCYEWILKKHYAKRIPRLQYCFGLYINAKLEGIITYGMPATPFVARGICGKEYENKVMELNRLVVNSETPKNSTSYLVANSIKMLPPEYKIIVSYADTSIGHIGYIYQATNFIYTGLTIDMKEWKREGINLHSQNVCKKMSLEERKKNPEFQQIMRPKKHRYILFRGSNKEKKELMKKLKYEKQPYPKGATKEYPCIEIKTKQTILKW